MLEHDKIDISEGIDLNKTSASKEFDVICIFYIKILIINPIFSMVVMI